MIDEGQDRAVTLAVMLGVVQEARRIGFRVVGTEHLLMATFSDPVVRTAGRGIGCDMRDVQKLVRHASEARGRGHCRESDPRPDPVELTPEAADVMLKAEALVGGLDLDTRPAPATFSAALGAVMLTLLHDDGDTAAHSILEELGVLRRAEDLVVRLRRSIDGPAHPPRRE